MRKNQRRERRRKKKRRKDKKREKWRRRKGSCASQFRCSRCNREPCRALKRVFRDLLLCK